MATLYYQTAACRTAGVRNIPKIRITFGTRLETESRALPKNSWRRIIRLTGKDVPDAVGSRPDRVSARLNARPCCVIRPPPQSAAADRAAPAKSGSGALHHRASTPAFSGTDHRQIRCPRHLPPNTRAAWLANCCASEVPVRLRLLCLVMTPETPIPLQSAPHDTRMRIT